jgi:hypothetical protein
VEYAPETQIAVKVVNKRLPNNCDSVPVLGGWRPYEKNLLNYNQVLRRFENKKYIKPNFR